MNSKINCNVKFVQTDVCNMTTFNGNLGEKLLCGTVEDVCKNITGSFLICNGHLSGIRSFDLECCNPKTKVNIYVDVTQYNNWIDEVFRSVLLTDNTNENQTDSDEVRRDESFSGSFYFEDPNQSSKKDQFKQDQDTSKDITETSTNSFGTTPNSISKPRTGAGCKDNTAWFV